MNELEQADLRGLDESLDMVPRTLYPIRNLQSLRAQITAMIGLANLKDASPDYLAGLAARLHTTEAQIAASDRREHPRQ